MAMEIILRPDSCICKINCPPLPIYLLEARNNLVFETKSFRKAEVSWAENFELVHVWQKKRFSLSFMQIIKMNTRLFWASSHLQMCTEVSGIRSFNSILSQRIFLCLVSPYQIACSDYSLSTDRLWYEDVKFAVRFDRKVHLSFKYTLIFHDKLISLTKTGVLNKIKRIN